MPYALTYDTLPPHSTLRREVVGEVVKITAAAEEPGAVARRVQLQRASFPAALLSGALLGVFIATLASTYLAHRRYMGSGLFAALVIAFIIFCAALFLFVWRVRYAANIESLEKALRQTTVLAASPGHLLIETAGPFGQESHDLCARLAGPDRIIDFRFGRLDGHPCLEIVLANGQSIRVLRGRDNAELRWVARALRTAIGL